MVEHSISIGPALVTKESVKCLRTALAPLTWLAIHADDRGAVQGPINIKALGDAWGCSVSTAKAMLKRLRSGGFIKTEATRQGLNIWLLAGKGLDFRRSAVDGGPESRPPESTSFPQTAGNPPATQPTVRPERFRPLVEAFVAICGERGWRPVRSWQDTEAILTWLREDRVVTADRAVQLLLNFSAVCNEHDFRFVRLADFAIAASAEEAEAPKAE